MSLIDTILVLSFFFCVAAGIVVTGKRTTKAVVNIQSDKEERSKKAASKAASTAQRERYKKELEQSSFMHKQLEGKEPTSAEWSSMFREVIDVMGITDVHEALRIWHLTEEQQRKNELRHIAFVEYCATIRGKEKYFRFLREGLERQQGMQKIAEAFKDANKSRSTATYRPKQYDPWFWGGVANGLAGPGAGLYMAQQTQEENEKSRQRAADMRQTQREFDATLSAFSSSADHNVRVLSESVIKARMIPIDDQHPDELFSKIRVDVEGIEPSPSGNPVLYVKCKFSCEPCSMHPEEDAKPRDVIDGSLKLTVLDALGKVVAEGTYVAPGFDHLAISDSWEGFSAAGRVSQSIYVACRVSDTMPRSMEELTCSASPLAIWGIEHGSARIKDEALAKDISHGTKDKKDVSIRLSDTDEYLTMDPSHYDPRYYWWGEHEEFLPSWYKE